MNVHVLYSVFPFWQESSKSIQIEAFHVFKVTIFSVRLHFELMNFKSAPSVIYVYIFTFLQLFAANQNKPNDIVGILVANRSKLLRLFADFKTDKGKKTLLLTICDSWLGSWDRVYNICFLLCCRGSRV